MPFGACRWRFLSRHRRALIRRHHVQQQRGADRRGLQTTAPTSLPMPAVRAMASAPQHVTRAVARTMFCTAMRLPRLAASRARKTKDAPDTMERAQQRDQTDGNRRRRLQRPDGAQHVRDDPREAFGRLWLRQPGQPAGLQPRVVPQPSEYRDQAEVMPFASVPTAAKRNSFSPERRKAKASELGISNS